MRIKLLLFVLLILQFGCNHNSIKRTSINLESTELIQLKIDDTLYISQIFNPRNMNIVRNHLIMTSVFQKNTDAIYLYDKIDLRFIGSFVPFGRGHDEIFDLNPNYFYSTDTSFFLNSNLYYENEFSIKNDSLIKINRKNITNQYCSNLYKVAENKFIINDIENNYEFTIQTGNSTNYEKIDKSSYPDFHNEHLDASDKYNLYNKSIVTFDDCFASFYYYVPIIRKYDSNDNLEKEYIITDYSNYKIKNVDEIFDNDIWFFRNAKIYKDIVSVILRRESREELLIFDKKLNLIKRYALDIDINLYAIDDHYLYILDNNNDPYCIYKINISNA